MGIYGGDLYVPTIPIVLPKLCLAITAVTEKDDPFESIEFHILKVKGDNETPLLSTDSLSVPTMPSDLDPPAASIRAQFTVVLSPFQIDEEFLLRVRAKTEKDELRGRGLRVRVFPTSTSEDKKQLNQT